MSDGVENRLQQIVTAALGCFTRYGYRRTSMETIARAAGVSRPALYQHFAGKEDVFRAGVVHMLDDAAAQAEERARAEAPVEERLYGVLGTKVDLVVGALDAEFRGELLTEAAAITGDLLDAHRERLLQITASVLESAAAELPQVGAELTARDAAALMLYAVTGIEFEHASAETAHIRVRQLVRLMLRGLRSS